MNDGFQKIMASTPGKITAVIVLIVVFLLIIIPDKKEKQNKKVDTGAMTISALMIAMSFILAQFKVFTMPQGGSITLFSMLPIVLCGYILGTRRGVMAGACVGILNLVFGSFVIHPVQMLLDYPIARGAMGLSGLCRDKKNGLIKGYVLGVFGRYICAVISGIIFFGSYAPENFNAVTWSLWYNATYLGVEAAITVAVLCIPAVRNAFSGLKKNYGVK